MNELTGTFHLQGHEGWVTSIACPLDNSDILLSSSRDKSVILWTLTREDSGPDGNYGFPRRSLRGHSHFVQDVVISSDGQVNTASAVTGSLTYPVHVCGVRAAE